MWFDPSRPNSTCWLRFASDRRGATAVEFGLIMVPFLGLLLGIFQIGILFFTSEGLEGAVQDAARNIYTGQAQAANISTIDAFRTTYLCPTTGARLLPGFIDCTKLIIDVRTATSFASANTNSDFYKTASTNQFCPGPPGSTVIVRVAYPMPVIIPVIIGTSTQSVSTLRTGMVNDVPGNPGWKQLLLGTAVFVNEPYAAASYTPPAGC